MAKITTLVGVYAGIICTESGPNYGKLMLYRRTVTTSIIEGVSFRGNFELPGRAMLTTESNNYGYNHAALTVEEAVLDRAGLRIFLPKMPAFYPVFLGSDKIADLAMVTVYMESHPVFAFTNGREVIWVDPAELHSLAAQFKAANEKEGVSGEGLISGLGKRMHCMALMALTQSPINKYATEATEELSKIQSAWPESL